MPGVLFLHETHLVAGYHEDAFEAAFRDGWMPTLAEDDDARLLWYCNLAHGSHVVVPRRDRHRGARRRRLRAPGPSHPAGRPAGLDARRSTPTVTTPSARCWCRCRGRRWPTSTSRRCPAAASTVIPSCTCRTRCGRTRTSSLEYIEASGSVYSKSLEHRDSGAPQFLEIEAGFQPAFGSHLRREVVLMQRILDVDRLRRSAHHRHPRARCARPGTWMHDALRCATSGRACCCAPRAGRPHPLAGGGLMLFVHETHEVVGLKEDEFETLFRTGWMPMLAEGDDARLLWYMNHAHGSGPAYNVVTITGVRDGAAWERLDERIRTGDLREWMQSVDALPPRRDRQGDAAGALVAHPGGRLRRRAHRRARARAAPVHGGHRLADVVARRLHPGVGRHLPSAAARATPTTCAPSRSTSRRASRTRTVRRSGARRCCGSGSPTRTTVLHLIATDLPIERREPGTYMYDALAFRDQWRSRLLRTAAWSPLY